MLLDEKDLKPGGVQWISETHEPARLFRVERTIRANEREIKLAAEGPTSDEALSLLEKLVSQFKSKANGETNANNE